MHRFNPRMFLIRMEKKGQHLGSLSSCLEEGARGRRKRKNQREREQEEQVNDPEVARANEPDPSPLPRKARLVTHSSEFEIG